MHDNEYASDRIRIQRVFKEHGYVMTQFECYSLWRSYSESYAANWIALPEDDDELWATLDFIKGSHAWWDDMIKQ